MTYKESLRKLGLFSLKKNGSGGYYQYIETPNGVSNKDRARLFEVVSSDRARIHGHKLKHRKLLLNIRKILF